VAAVLFALIAEMDPGGAKVWEFSCLLTGPPARQEILFGVAEGVEGWDDRWSEARRSAEYVYFDAIGKWAYE
jgi:hypothetical protein